MSTIIQQIEQEQMRKGLPSFSPGDTVCVWVNVKEGTRNRAQAFEGVVLSVCQGGLNANFTVRKISHGEGVERVFQTHSPMIDKIEIKRRGKVRQAKLYYLRDLQGRAARIKEDLGKSIQDRAAEKAAAATAKE